MNGEIVPNNVSENDLRDEVNLRTSRAGYTTRSGDPTYRQKIGVGWSRRYEENYKLIRKE
jgi:hypothetical protein